MVVPQLADSLLFLFSTLLDILAVVRMRVAREKELKTCIMDVLEVEGFETKRKRILGAVKSLEKFAGRVLYWMSRDQRVQGKVRRVRYSYSYNVADNWALVYSQKLALKHRVPLLVCFCLVTRFLDATIRQFNFMLEGLKEVEMVEGNNSHFKPCLKWYDSLGSSAAEDFILSAPGPGPRAGPFSGDPAPGVCCCV